MALLPVALKINLNTSQFKENNDKNLSLPELKKESRATNRRDALSISRLAEVASEAVNSISALREKQSDLIARSGTANDESKSRINTDLTDLQSEITRISQNATYNGVNALSGGTFLISDSANNSNKVVSLSNIEYISQNYNFNVSTTRTRRTATNNIDTATFSSGIANNGASSSYSDSQKIVTEIIDKENLEQNNADPESTTESISKLSAELVQKYLTMNNENSDNSVNLEPEQIKQIISKIV